MNNKKQRNRLFTMLLLVMAILMPYGGAWAQTKPSSGNGSADKPYKISTADELAWFRDQVSSAGLLSIGIKVHLMATGRLPAISTSMPPLIIPVTSAMLMLAVSRISLSTMRG